MSILDSIQMQRNKLLSLNHERQVVQNQLIQVNQELDTNRHNIQRRAELLEAKLTHLKTLESQQFMTVEQYDKMVQPYVVAFYENCNDPGLQKESIPNSVNLDGSTSIATIDTTSAEVCDLCATAVCFDNINNQYICTSCGLVQAAMNTYIYSNNANNKVEYSTFSYRRINHLQEILKKIQGLTHINIPGTVLEQIMMHLVTKNTSPDQISLSGIRSVLKSHKELAKYLDHDTQIYYQLSGTAPLRLEAHVKEKIMIMFIAIQQPFAKVCPDERKNFLSYPYCLYKFSQLLGLNDVLHYFPLLKSQKKLQVQEDIFARICAVLKWPFIPIAAEHRGV